MQLPVAIVFIYLLDLPSLRVSRTVLSLVELVTSRISVSSKGEEGVRGGQKVFRHILAGNYITWDRVEGDQILLQKAQVVNLIYPRKI